MLRRARGGCALLIRLLNDRRYCSFADVSLSAALIYARRSEAALIIRESPAEKLNVPCASKGRDRVIHVQLSRAVRRLTRLRVYHFQFRGDSGVTVVTSVFRRHRTTGEGIYRGDTGRGIYETHVAASRYVTSSRGELRTTNSAMSCPRDVAITAAAPAAATIRSCIFIGLEK